MEKVILKNKLDEAVVYTSDSKNFIIGRGEKAECLIPVQGVSKAHAEVLKYGSNWYIRDLGSTNGTYLNSEQLQSGELYILRPTDELSFGSHLCVIGDSRSTIADPSLSVFKDDVYQGEFLIGLSTSFTYGGLKATIPSPEPDSGELIFLVKREGKELLVVQKNREVKPFLNGVLIEGRINLKDRDKIAIGNLLFVVSIQVPLTAEQVIQKEVDEAAPVPDYFKGRIGDDSWGDSTNKRKNAGTLLSLEDSVQDESKRLGVSQGGLGVNRFSTTRARIQEANVKREKTELFLGVFTVISSIFMASILLYLYAL